MFIARRRVCVQVELNSLKKLADEDAPFFSVSEGRLAAVTTPTTVNILVTAIDPEGLTLTYDIPFGQLPGTVTLNPTTGQILGSIPRGYYGPDGVQEYTFTIRATDAARKFVLGTFSILVEEPDPCATKPCPTNSTCIRGGVDYDCVEQCFAGFCANGGTCVVVGEARACTCPTGFGGATCSVRDACLSMTCVHGRCVDGACQCADAYTGTHCEIAPTGCTNTTCLNSGACTTAGCVCARGYTGATCSDRSRDGSTSSLAADGCVALREAGYTTDGMYWIRLPGGPVRVFCDQTTDGGGWIVLVNYDTAQNDYSVHPTSGTYMHQDQYCNPATNYTLGSVFSCVSRLHTARIEQRMAVDDGVTPFMFYVVHADAPSRSHNPWLRTAIKNIVNLQAFLSHKQPCSLKCGTSVQCEELFHTMMHGGRNAHNNWYSASYRNPGLMQMYPDCKENYAAINHMWNGDTGYAGGNNECRCNSDFDRLHQGWDSRVGVAYHENGGANCCKYRTDQAALLFSRLMLRL